MQPAVPGQRTPARSVGVELAGGRLLHLDVDLLDEGARRDGRQQTGVAQTLIGLALDGQAPQGEHLLLLIGREV